MFSRGPLVGEGAKLHLHGLLDVTGAGLLSDDRRIAKPEHGRFGGRFKFVREPFAARAARSEPVLDRLFERLLEFVLHERDALCFDLLQMSARLAGRGIGGEKSLVVA